MLVILFIILSVFLCISLIYKKSEKFNVNGKGWGNVNGIVGGDYPDDHPSWIYEYPYCYSDCVDTCVHVCKKNQTSEPCINCQKNCFSNC